MASLLLELSRLEVESLGITTNAPEQERKLDTLVHGDTAALLLEDGASRIEFGSSCQSRCCGIGPSCSFCWDS
jgi:hypothetical protein